MNNEVAIKVEHISKKYCKSLKRSMLYGIKDIARNMIGLSSHSEKLRKGEFWAVDDVSFEVKKGETLGIIGPNGSGKTTLLKMLNGIFWPDKGKIMVKARVGALIEVGAGFHPLLTGRENIYINGSILGMTKKEIDNKFDEIVDFADIGDFIDAPVKHYSSGMFVRLGFAIAIHMEPDILLLDEILAVGDISFRMKCYHRIGEILEKTAVVFVSHDILQTSRICDSVVVMQQGKPVFEGETEIGIEKYLKLASSPNLQLPKLILNHCIQNFSCSSERDTLAFGETLRIELSFETKTKLTTGLCLIAMEAGGVWYAQTDFSHILTNIPKGKSHLTLELGPLYLRRDEYSVCITVFGESKKNTLAHFRHAFRFKMLGDRGFGVAYQFPLTVVSEGY